MSDRQLTNEEVIEKADSSISKLTPGGLLNEKQSARFVKVLGDILEGEQKAAEALSEKLVEALRPFVGEEMNEVTRLRLQGVITGHILIHLYGYEHSTKPGDVYHESIVELLSSEFITVTDGDDDEQQ